MTFAPTWESLRCHSTPQWFRDAKFGIYTHWGVYSVPAQGPNATWYPYNMYREGTPQYEHHVQTYGHPLQFGYKDFIPMFTAERFDPEQWANLFKRAGAQFAGPVAEHHDGFCMWDSKLTTWNAVEMGPKRDVVGHLERAIRGQGLRFMTALHHAENWWFYPHWRKDFDTSDPRFAGLYGPPHNQEWQAGEPAGLSRPELWQAMQRPDRAWLEIWLAKTREVIDYYHPDMIWFDFGLGLVQEQYRKRMLAYYYNRAAEWGREVVVTYKWDNMVSGSGVVDLELGRFNKMTYNDWITDTTVDAGQGWGYLRETGYKTATGLIHYLVDNVSKNGYMLLNVGPMPNGEIPQQAQDLLLAIGRWLEVNGEAIYGTSPWLRYGEGPTLLAKSGPFMEGNEVSYTPSDIRFTTKGDTLYAVCLGWPGQRLTIGSLASLYPAEIASVHLLGHDTSLPWSWSQRQGLTVTFPTARPCDHAYVVKIARHHIDTAIPKEQTQ